MKYNSITFYNYGGNGDVFLNKEFLRTFIEMNKIYNYSDKIVYKQIRDKKLLSELDIEQEFKQ